jgi:PAS domain S-box-containing protein
LALVLSSALRLSYLSAKQTTDERARNTAVAVERGLSGTLAQIDQALVSGKFLLEQRLSTGNPALTTVDEFIQRSAPTVYGISAYRYCDEHGSVSAFAGFPKNTPAVNISDRDYFQTLRQNDPGGLVTSKPLIGRSIKEWVIVFARSYRYPDGKFAGVVYASVKLDHFEKTFGALNLGKNSTVTLVDKNFELIANYPQKLSPDWIGRRIESPDVIAQLSRGTSEFTTTYTSSLSHVHRRVAVQKLQVHPFWLGVGLDIDDELRPWRKQCSTALLVMILFTALTSIAGYAVQLGWRKQQETLRKLSESEGRYRFISEKTEDVIWIVDAKTLKFTYVSPSVERLRGYTPDEVVNRKLDEVSTAESAHEAQQLINEAIASFRPGGERCITRVSRSNQTHRLGHVVPTETAMTIVFDDTGRPTEFVGVTRNISERLRAEEALRQSEESYRRLIENSHEYIAELDLQGCFVYASPNHETDFSYTIQELLGAPYTKHLHPEDVAIVTDAFSAILKDGHASVSFRLISKTGTVRWFQSTGKLYVTPTGESRILTFSRDTTEQQKAEANRKQLEEQLHTSQKMEAIGLLAGGVAHDFNNLLAIILSYTEFAMIGLSKAERRYNDLLGVKKAAERAGDLTRQLLAFSRKQHWQPSVLDLNRLLLDFEKMLQRILGEGISYERNLTQNAALIFADYSQIEQIVMNLVVNARDAMPLGGKLTVETSNIDFTNQLSAREAGLEPGHYVRLVFSDTGHGMDEATSAHIFDPFFTTKERGKGTGLGLSIVYGIVQKCGGAITVKSHPGVGTTFSLFFPRAESEVEPLANLADSSLASTAQGTETVLVVEDDDDLREVVRRHLEAAGYTALIAADGLQAFQLSALHHGPIELLLTDVIMPHMNGCAVADELRRQRPAIKVLYMSGYTDNALAEHGILDQNVHLLAKPFTSVELLRKLRERLDAKDEPLGPKNDGVSPAQTPQS